MVIYADLLREALEPPVVEIGGQTYTGKILSHVQFLRHEEALYLTLHQDVDEKSSVGVLREQFEIIKDFLEEVFPVPPIPNKPKEPKQLNIFEKTRYWLSGNDPKRWHDYVETIDIWDAEREEAVNKYCVNKILEHPNVFQIVAKLFTYQRGVWNTEQRTLMNEKQSNEDLLKDPSPSEAS